jgi:SPOR domain
MRALFVVLVVANLLLAAYALLTPLPRSPDAGLLDSQLNADKIRIVPPRPAVIPARQGACIEWGAFSAAELPAAREAIGALDLGARVSAVEVQTIAGWWVYIPPLKSRAEVERKVAELTELGVDEYFTVENGEEMRNAISLGIFRSEEAANNYLQTLRDKGVRSAQVGRRDHRVTQTAFLVRNPDPAISARMAELTTRFPGSELKAKDCPG